VADPHGDGSIAVNLTRLDRIIENWLTSGGLALFIAAFKAQLTARPSELME
jgi:hypothetical protein